jgi:hypothetical protein
MDGALHVSDRPAKRRACAIASLDRHLEARVAAVGRAQLHPESRDWLKSLEFPDAEARASDAQGNPIEHHTSGNRSSR